MYKMISILLIFLIKIITATNQNSDFDKFLALARKTRLTFKYLFIIVCVIMNL